MQSIESLENKATDVLREARDSGHKSGAAEVDSRVGEAFCEAPTQKSDEMAEQNARRTALENIFSNAPNEQVELHRDSLSPWHKIWFDHRVGKLRRDEALKIARAAYEREFEAVLQKLTLALDIEKKAVFVTYLRSTGSLQRELQRLDSAACLALQQSLLSIDAQIFSVSNENEKVIAKLLADSIITQQQAESEKAKNERLCKRALDNALTTLDNLWANHKGLLDHTLKLFFEQLTSTGKL